MRKSTPILFFYLFITFLFITRTATAQLQNIACTGYNEDVVANGSGTSQSSTTNSVDGNSYVLMDGTFKPGSSICNTSNVWKTSLATSGTSGLTYTMQSASANNALQVLAGDTGKLTVTTPIAANKLYVLAFGGNGDCPVTAIVKFTDNSTQVFTSLTAPDWCSGSLPVTSKFYRTLRNTTTSCGGALCPFMFEMSLSISTANQYRKISSISFYNGTGTGILNVFAVGGYVLSSIPACSTPSAQPTTLSLTPSTTAVTGSFTASSSADSYLIVRSTSISLTATPVDGVIYTSGNTIGNGTVVKYQSGTTFADDGLTQGTIYYYFVFAANSNCSGGPLYLSTSPLSDASTTTKIGATTFTASDTWTCPSGVTTLTSVECWGGGGGGGYGNNAGAGGGGGGGGAYTKKTSISVTPGTEYAVVVGGFGAAGLSSVNSGNGGDGGASSFNGTTVVANGGSGGKSYTQGASGGNPGNGTSMGGKGASGTSSQSGGGGGGAGTSGAGYAASGKTGGALRTSNGGAGGTGTSSYCTTGGFGSSYGGGGAGGTGNGGCGAQGAVIITCPCTSFYPTFVSSAAANTCKGSSVIYTTQSGQSNYTWSVPGTSGTDYTITAGGIGTSSNTVTIKWLTTGSKTVTVNYSIGTSCSGVSAATSTTTVVLTPTVSSVVADSICGSGTATLEATSSAGTINWYSAPTGAGSLSTGNSFTTPSISSSTTYYVDASYTGCTSISRTAVTAVVSPLTSTWKGTSSTSWTDAANWTPSAPGTCSNVIIDSTATYLPNLSALSSNVKCNDITFDAGTTIYGLNKLTYQRAFVHVSLKRNKWYMLTCPLKEMYSGDYYFLGSPVSYMKLFGTTQANTNTFSSTYCVTGNWTTSFANLTQTLTPGQGFAFKLDSTEWHYPTGRSYSGTDKTIIFPRMNADSSLVTKMIPYAALTGKPLTSLASTVTRDASKAYRFAMENSSDKLTTMNISVDAGFNLIGNPLMSYLDFKKIYADNSSLINAYAYFWDGSSFGSIKTDGTTSGTAISGLSTDIPPMKSFIVNATTTGTLVLKLTHFIATGGVALKSTSTKDSLMYIEVDNGGDKNSTAILMGESATNGYDSEDVVKLFSPLKTIPEVYTVADNNALDINQFSKLPYTVPLGITANGAKTVNLTFAGAESFDGIDVSLTNTTSGESQNLKSNNSYSFNYDGSNGEGTLFLEFKSANVVTSTPVNKSNNAEKIQVLVKNNNQIYIVSSSDNLLQEILVYDPVGKELTHQKNLNQSVINFAMPQGTSVCLVRVTSQKGTTVRKVLMK